MENKIINIKKNKEFYTITINKDDYTIDSYFYECLLPYNGKIVDNNTLKEIKAFSNAHILLKKMYNKIFSFSISTFELKDYLIRNGISDDDLKIIINFLKQENHLNDENFANNFKEHYELNKGVKAFESFLISKRVNKNIIDKVINEYNENYDYAMSYANLLIKNKTSSNEMLKYKIKANLLNKGFSYDVINYVLNNITYNDEQINLKKDLQKIIKKYPSDYYKVVSKLAIKGYNVDEIKKALKEEGVKNED